MAKFHIGFSKPPEIDQSIDYRIDASEYATNLLARWPYAVVGRYDLSPYYILTWELNKENELGASGGLQSDGLTVSFERNPQEDAVDFALWHREFVPNQYVLFLYDNNLDVVYELRPNTTREALVAIFSYLRVGHKPT
jgi:hypothetical protein